MKCFSCKDIVIHTLGFKLQFCNGVCYIFTKSAHAVIKLGDVILGKAFDDESDFLKFSFSFTVYNWINFFHHTHSPYK
jgi:hypothetical protein